MAQENTSGAKKKKASGEADTEVFREVLGVDEPVAQELTKWYQEQQDPGDDDALEGNAAKENSLVSSKRRKKEISKTLRRPIICICNDL